MAVDSQTKRASVLGIVQPDSTIAQTDRQTVLWVYGGIEVGEAAEDTIAPADVTGLSLYANDETITAVWTDPVDEDLEDIIVSWEPGSGESDPVAAGTGFYLISSLTNDTEYTVTVVARDAVPNSSEGISDTATPAAPAGGGAYASRSPIFERKTRRRRMVVTSE